MPPKTKPSSSAAPEYLEDLCKMISVMSTQLNNITSKLENLDVISDRLDTMEESMSALVEENNTLKLTVTSKDSTITRLQSTVTAMESKINRMEQYNRSWSVRILILQISAEEEKNPFTVKGKAYEVFLPILKGAYEERSIPFIPTADQLLEVAHVLPGKAGHPKPVICRFLNRDFRSACLRLKTKDAARDATGANRSGASNPERRGKYSNPFFEDLTCLTADLMRQLNLDHRVHACWSVNGQLRYRLVNSETVMKVPELFNSVEEILG